MSCVEIQRKVWNIFDHHMFSHMLLFDLKTQIITHCTFHQSIAIWRLLDIDTNHEKIKWNMSNSKRRILHKFHLLNIAQKGYQVKCKSQIGNIPFMVFQCLLQSQLVFSTMIAMKSQRNYIALYVYNPMVFFYNYPME